MENTPEDYGKKAVVEVAKEIAGDAYNDLGKPIVKPTGELVGLVPRAIKAALEPLEKWILCKEYNILETKKLLEDKLSGIDPQKIVSPDGYVAVPALQAISYSMDSEYLREMYANLLAKSMNSDLKDSVHPSFVEVIKQMSPFDAQLLKSIVKRKENPILNIRFENSRGEGYTVFKDFYIPQDIKFKEFSQISASICNLERLKLIEVDRNRHYIKKELYATLESHEFIILCEKEGNKISERNEGLEHDKKIELEPGMLTLSPFGLNFQRICIV